MPARWSLRSFSFLLALLLFVAPPLRAEDEGTEEGAAATAAESEAQGAETQNEADKEENEEEAEEETKQEEEPQEPEAPPEPRRLGGLGSLNNPQLPGQPWRVHDLYRPRPPVVAPPDADLSVPPPGDAIVLFDGSDLSHWGQRDSDDPAVYRAPQWKVEEGYLEVARGGDLYTLDSFASVQLHLEWAVPEEARGSGQGRGNSGVKLMGLYEVQILDSYNNRTYADGQAASIYGQYPPEVNVSREPGKWQSYDIVFEIPEFDEEGEVVRPGYLTVLHNGVLVHHRRELAGITGMRSPGKYSPHPPGGPIMLQAHGSPVRFRNIWVRPISKQP